MCTWLTNVKKIRCFNSLQLLMSMWTKEYLTRRYALYSLTVSIKRLLSLTTSLLWWWLDFLTHFHYIRQKKSTANTTFSSIVRITAWFLRQQIMKTQWFTTVWVIMTSRPAASSRRWRWWCPTGWTTACSWRARRGTCRGRRARAAAAGTPPGTWSAENKQSKNQLLETEVHKKILQIIIWHTWWTPRRRRAACASWWRWWGRRRWRWRRRARRRTGSRTSWSGAARTEIEGADPLGSALWGVSQDHQYLRSLHYQGKDQYLDH